MASKLTANLLRTDDVMGPLIGQLGEKWLTEESRVNVAVEWWIAILTDDKFDRNTLVETMVYPTFCISMESKGGVLTRIARDEQEDRAAHLMAYFLFKTYKTNRQVTDECWGAIKDCVYRLFYHDEDKFKKVLFAYIPKWLKKEIDQDRSIDQDDKTAMLVQLPYHFPADDKLRFETYLAASLIRS
jgi:hypothetical protein